LHLPEPPNSFDGVALLAFAVFALAPLTAPGYFIYAHDARHSVYFLQMFDAAIREGVWYPRWATDMVFGYGYPVWILFGPVQWYLGEFYHLLGLDFVWSIKMVYATAYLASGLTMYLFAARVLGKNAGLVAALAYLYIPYHVVDVYVRAAEAEFFSFVWPPLILWAFYELAERRAARFIPIAALCLAGLLLTHITMAVVWAPAFVAYGLLLTARGWQKQPVWENLRFPVYALASAIFAVGVAAIAVLPSVFETQYFAPEPLIGGFFNFRQHFVFASQLLSPFWGYSYAGINGTDQFSLQLGLIPLALALVALVAAARIANARIRALVWFCAGVSVVYLALMLPISAGAWELVARAAAFVQFPWRLLIVTSLTLAFLAGAVVHALDETEARIGALLLGLIVVLGSYPYAQPQYTDARFDIQALMQFELKDHELLGDTIWVTERPETSPLVEQYLSGAPLQKAIALDGNATVTMLEHRTHSDAVRVTSANGARILFYTHYFPGWSAFIDDQSASVDIFGDQGLILVSVPEGTHTVRVAFVDTPIRRIGAWVTAISLILALAWMGLARRI
jgi:hypothetical protein